MYPLSDEEFWLSPDKPNVDAIKEHLRREGRITDAQFRRIVQLTYEIFCSEENILRVPAPVTGDFSVSFPHF